MPESSELYTTRERETAIRKVSWGAIFSGVALFLVVFFTLSVLGAAIGLTTVDPAQEQEPAAGLGIGAAIWGIISMIIALFVGGWAASRLSTAWSKLSGTLHGLVTWAVSIVLLLWLMTTAIGSVLGGAMSALQSPALSQVAPQLQQRAQQAIPQNGDGEQIAQRASEISATAAWGIFIMLLLGAVAAAIGGSMGTPELGAYAHGVGYAGERRPGPEH
jgi:hypothetical protein